MHQPSKALDSWRTGEKARDIDKQRIERSQLLVVPPVHKSDSPRTTPLDMLNLGLQQPQRTMPMQHLLKIMQHISHHRMRKH
jgi:hypothetical protein